MHGLHIKGLGNLAFFATLADCEAIEHEHNRTLFRAAAPHGLTGAANRAVARPERHTGGSGRKLREWIAALVA